MSHIYHETKFQDATLKALASGSKLDKERIIEECLLEEGFAYQNDTFTRREYPYSVVVKLTEEGVRVKAFSQDDESSILIEWGGKLESLWKEIEHCRWLQGYHNA